MSEVITLNFEDVDGTPMMSHRQIAELVGSGVSEVKRSMERLEKKGLIVTAPLTHIAPVKGSSGGRVLTNLMVNEEHSYVVVAQLSPEFTAALVKQWMSFKDALIAIATSKTEDAEELKAQAADAIREYVHEAMLINKPRHRIRGFFEGKDVAKATAEFLSCMAQNRKATYEDRTRTAQSLRKVINEYYDSLHAREHYNAAMCEESLKMVAEYERYIARLDRSRLM